jgi:hypothetical protein
MKFSKEYNLEKHMAVHSHPPTVQVRKSCAPLLRDKYPGSATLASRIWIRNYFCTDPDPSIN